MNARDEQDRRRQEALHRYLPSPFVADRERMLQDRVAFRLAIRRYEEQRAIRHVAAVEVVA